LVIAVITILSALIFLYAGTLLTLARGFHRLPSYSANPAMVTPVSVIICARNEEKTLRSCLEGILAQDYPRNLVQIIVVNDSSSDSTALLADTVLENGGVDYRILSNPLRKGKKKSIASAIRFARHELVVLRDADTFTGSLQWLRQVCDQHTRYPGLLIGPVLVSSRPGVLSMLQFFESAILTVVTGGSAGLGKPFLCSGANMAFTKTIFERTGGFRSHEHLLSGDDVFFLEDVKKLGDVPITFLKSRQGVVETYPLPAFRQLLLQKGRWASKFRYNPNLLNLWLAFFVFTANLAVVFALAAIVFKPQYRGIAATYIFLKIVTDIFLLSVASGFIGKKIRILYVLPVALVYPFYATLVALLSMFIKPAWKEE
jgi:poly-beta-1,6-N-acetyl-D-glucosamine synthase